MLVSRGASIVISDQSTEPLLLVECLTLCPAELSALPALFHFVGQTPAPPPAP